MTASEFDPLDLQLLYGVAVGFVGDADPVMAQRHALLSAMGACAARWSLLYRRARGEEYRLDGRRGAEMAAPERFKISARIEAMLMKHGSLTLARSLSARRDLIKAAGLPAEAAIVVPCRDNGRVTGLLVLGSRLFGDPYRERDELVLAEIGALTARALFPARDGGPHAIPETNAPSKRVPRRPETQADQIRRRHPALQTLIGHSPAIVAVMQDILAYADSQHPVLIHGETGTGKDLVARALHDQGPRRRYPFETVNCVALPEGLAESALFGHRQGAFTGADRYQKGQFELAGRGSLFLDELGDLPLSQQAKLLLVLQENKFRPIGAESSLRFEARILVATHRNLVEEVRSKRFREDLFYRVYGLTISVPPLRQRLEDLPDLVDHFIALNRAPGQRMQASDAFLADLARDDFRGNIRQLRWAVIRAMVRCGHGRRLLPEHLDGDLARLSELHAAPIQEPVVPSVAPAAPTADSRREESASAAPPAKLPNYEGVLRAYLMDVLRLTNGNITQAQHVMQKPRTTVQEMVRKFDLNAFVAECRRRR